MALSYDSYTGDGSTTQFAVTFGYITASDVDVKVDGVSVSFTWDNAAQVNCAVAPANGTSVIVVRDTQRTSRLVDFTAASLLDEESLDKDSNQLFYIVQEAFDDLSNALQYDATTGEFNANSKRIKNLADGVSNDEAVNKGQIAALTSTAVTAAEAAQAAAEAAQALAETAQTNAETAETNAETAETAAEAAQAAAETAQTGAETAETNAETAQTGAETAEDLAQEWASKAEDLAITGNPGYYSALHWAAKAQAFAAAATVTGGTTDNLVSINASDVIEDSGVAKGNVLQKGVAAEVTKQINFDEQTLTSSSNAVAWNVENGPCAVHTLTENTTISAPSNLKAGGVYVLRVVQAAGVYTLAFNAVFKWGAADTPTAPAASGDVVIFSGYSDGTSIYMVESCREEA